MRSKRELLASLGAAIVGFTVVGPSPTLTAQAAGTTITVDTSRTVGTLPADVLGLSFEADRLHQTPGFDPSQGNIAALMQNLGPSVIRIGANAVDRLAFWDPSGAPLPSWATTPVTPTDLDRVARLSAATGWHTELAVNLGHEDPTSIGSEAKAAASAFAAHPGSDLRDMECGNEPNLFVGSGLRPTGWGYPQFTATDFPECVNAIGNSAPVAGPNTNGGAWEPAFANDEHNRVIELHDQQYSLHGGPKTTATLTQLLSAATDSTETSTAAPLITDASNVGLRMRRDETNSVNIGGVHGVSDVYGTSLWAVDYILLLARAGISGFNFNGTLGQCGQPEGGSGWIYYYTPLCAASAGDLSAGILAPQPVYYGLLMAHQMGAGQFLPVTLSTTANLTAYAITASDGTTRVMVVDKDPTTAGPVSTSVNIGAAFTGAADELQMTGSSLTSSTGIAIQGASVGRDGHFTVGAPTQLTVSGGAVSLTIPSGSATLLTFRSRPNPTVSSPPVDPTATATGGGQATVQWSAPADDGGSPVQAYSIYQWGSDRSQRMYETFGTSVTATGLSPGTYYIYTITAWNGVGWSGWSAWSNWALAS